LWYGKISDKSLNSIEVSIKKKRKEGINSKQWFNMQNFNKRFKKLEYRASDYFNENDTYLFQRWSVGWEGFFTTKVFYDRGAWWTVEKEVKATTLKCLKQ